MSPTLRPSKTHTPRSAVERAKPSPLPSSLAFLFLALLLLMGLPGAAGHAALVSAEPPRNSELDSAPSELILRFSEPYEEQYTRVTVTDEEEVRYDQANHFEEGNTIIRVPLEDMPDGVYTVHWRTLGTDTHRLQGRYLLGVNVTFEEGAIPSGGGEMDEVPEGAGAEIAVRTVAYLASSLAAGISLFVLVLPRGDPLDAARRIHHRVTAIAGIGAAGATLLLLLIIAGRIDGSLIDVIGTTSGGWVALRGVAFAVAGAIAFATSRWPGNIRRDDAAVAVFGLIGLFATAMSGHAASELTLRAFAIAVHFLHLAAVAFWLGGVLLLALLVSERVDGPILHATMRRFSPLAVAAVALIIVTGAAASGLRILGPSDLIDTVYGRALLIKIVLIVPLIGLGALNRYVIQPRMATADPARATRHLRKSVLAEVGIMAVMLVAAGTLTTVAPPDTLGDDQTGSDPVVGAVLDEFEAAGMHFTLRALPDPLTVGRQNLTVEADRSEGTTAEVHTIFLITRAPDEGPDAEGTNERFTQLDDDTWYLSGFIMSSPGVWHNDLLIQGRGIFHEQHVPMFVE